MAASILIFQEIVEYVIIPQFLQFTYITFLKNQLCCGIIYNNKMLTFDVYKCTLPRASIF